MRFASMLWAVCVALPTHAQDKPAVAVDRVLPPVTVIGSPDESERLNPYEWKKAQKAAFELSENIYNDALKRTGLVAQYRTLRDAYQANGNRAFRIVFGQYLSWYHSFVGDYAAAHDAYSIRQRPEPDDAPSPLTDDYQAKSAEEAIAQLARGRKAVFFNEAHNVAQTRIVTLKLLKRLRQMGFTHFAAETLYRDDMEKLRTRGYPVAESGFYTQEPIHGEIVRDALKLGFTVVAYESEGPGNGDIREIAQAENLRDRVFADDPEARLVVLAGYGHIQEKGVFVGGRSMAQHFTELTGIDPLTVEQTMMIDHPPGAQNHPYYGSIIAAKHPSEPIVFMNPAAKPWTLKPGAYDMSVIFPLTLLQDGRPTWATLGGERVPYAITDDPCRGSYPCLAEARYAHEGADAIPADRYLLNLDRNQGLGDNRVQNQKIVINARLFLRPGQYRLRFVDGNNRTLSSQTISVKGSIEKADRKTPNAVL